jgi:hypothetical protein
MKIFKISLVAVIFCGLLPAPKLHAQVPMPMKIDPSFVEREKSKTVIVEMMEEDPKLVEKLSKKEKNADRLQHYRDFISSNNVMLKKAVDKYWKFNTDIQYKTTSELYDYKKENKGFMVLSVGFIASGSSNNWDVSKDIFIPVLYYTNSGSSSDFNYDYEVYLPAASIPDKEPNARMWSYMQCDYDFAIREMLASFDYVKSSGQKTKF